MNAGHKVYICYQESDTALIKATALAIFKSMILPYLEYFMVHVANLTNINYKLFRTMV